MAGPKKGITADRKNSEKLDFIVEHYNSMSREQLASNISETPRWVKRQIAYLKKNGRITPKRPVPQVILTEADWPETVKQRAISLRKNKLMFSEDICKILKEEFSFDVPAYTLEYRLIKLGCSFRTKEDWLKEFFPKDQVIKLIEDGYKIKEISDVIEKTHGVYISDDIILVYLQSLGIESQKNRRIRIINDRANEFSKEWLNDQIQSHAALSGLTSKMSVSKTVVMKRIKEEGLSLIKHRKIWSQNLELIRDLMMGTPTMKVSVSDEDFHQMMLGWLLGDGSLDFNGRFVTNHALYQLSYLYVKFQILRKYVTNIVTVPSLHFSGDGSYLGRKEQIGISCSGLNFYCSYLNEDGSKNFEKIVEEMNDLGWACYYMDDGSFFSGNTIMSMSIKLANKYANKYRFKGIILKNNLVVEGIISKYMIPHMMSKVKDVECGEFYWKKYFSELFDVQIKNDFDLCFINDYVCETNENVLTDAVGYYHKRGFPEFKISDLYLKKEWERLLAFNPDNLWKNDNTMRYLTVGNAIFKNFMTHMVDAKYRNTSPKEIFSGFSTLASSLAYTLKSKKSILPDYLHDSLIHFNGGVVGFPCSVAKSVVDRFSPVGGSVVDPCSGWGGRLLGACSVKRSYFGFEPWDKTHGKLLSMIEFFGFQDVSVINSPFDITKAPESCDLIFTSPPYVDLEVYGKPFSKNDWDTLMKDIFEYAEKSLVSGGCLILNLPSFLKGMLPVTTLKEKSPVYWNTSSRARTLDKSECLYVWKKA